MCKRVLVLAVMLAVTAGLSAGAGARRGMMIGLFDDAQVQANPDMAFETFTKLRATVARVNLNWGGRFGVATKKPKDPFDPADPAYDWSHMDDVVTAASKAKIKLLFSIVTTPRWDGGGASGNRAPANYRYLRGFAKAAARRYSGSYTPKDADKPL